MPLAYSHGNPDAKIYFLGGYGTEEDVNTGKALSGTIERSLTGFLMSSNIRLNETYRAVWIKELLSYRGNDRKRKLKALESLDVDSYTAQLKEEILQLQPKVIVPLDDIALTVVYPSLKGAKLPQGRKSWMHCFRGSVLELRPDWRYKFTDPVCVIPTYGPQSWYADPSFEMLAKLDLQRISKARTDFTAVEEDWKLWICHGIESLTQFVERQLAKNPEFLAFDIETWGGIPWCICLCFDGKESMSVGLVGEKWHVEEQLLVWKLIAKLLADKNLKKSNQNIKYDQIILERFGFVVETVWWDTMVVQNSTYPELPKGLDILTSIHTNIPYYKDEGKEYNPAGKRHGLQLYNAKDGIAAWRVTNSQREDVKDLSQNELVEKWVMPTLQVYKQIDERGIFIDQEAKEYLIEKYENLYEMNIATLRQISGSPELNPRSSQQLGKLIYEELKYPKRTKTDDDGNIKYKTDKDTLDDLLLYHGEKNKLGKIGASILRRAIVCRKLGGVVNYLSTPLHPDNSWHCTYTMGGTSTHRSNASKTIDRRLEVGSFKNGILKLRTDAKEGIQLGRSLQTITKHGFQLDEELWDDFESKSIADDMRKIFVARPGYELVEWDGSAAEARVVATLQKNWTLLDGYDRKPKVHAVTAGAIFDLDPNTITSKGPSIPGIGMTYYDMGKRARHATNLGIEEFRLAQMTHLPLEECKKILDKMHEIDPSIKGVFHREIEQLLWASKSLTTPHGFFRHFFKGVNKKNLKEAYSYIPQCTISRHTAFSMMLVRQLLHEKYSDFQDNFLWFLVEAHDGTLAEVKKGWRMRVLECAKQVYERPIDMNRGSMPRDIQLVIPAELSWGESWGHLEEISL